MAYAFLCEKIPELKSKYSQYDKINDYDKLVDEINLVYFTRLQSYMLFNFNSKTEDLRIRAYNCAKILVAISYKYLDKNKSPFKQFISSFTEIAQWYNKQKDNEKTYVDR